ncbi:MAG: hypothetical protein ACUVXD_12085, partial [Thermodesulfobacteriota bacterium]
IRRETMILKRDEIVAEMNRLREGSASVFKIPLTFGGGFAVIQLNTGDGKRYILRLSREGEPPESAVEYWASDKAKDVAKWVADRLGDHIVGEQAARP